MLAVSLKLLPGQEHSLNYIITALLSKGNLSWSRDYLSRTCCLWQFMTSSLYRTINVRQVCILSDVCTLVFWEHHSIPTLGYYINCSHYLSVLIITPIGCNIAVRSRHPHTASHCLLVSGKHDKTCQQSQDCSACGWVIQSVHPSHVWFVVP